MENFVLYDEIGRGEKTVVYKGRRKGTITFLAIHCIEKSKRPYITNRVRLTHELHHVNIVEFYEWYETSNHLWLVVELCTGGSLETILAQDGYLPESCLRKFGVDIVRGLHQIHSLGIVYSDMKPSKLLIDGPGVLKFSDFELARAEGESLDELFNSFIETAENERDDKIVFETNGSPSYMAPEVTRGGTVSFSSDLWSLGCVLYEMFTGQPPFEADSYQQLVNKIQTQNFPTPRVKGARLTSKPSPEFTSLISGLLQKDPKDRIGWASLVVHPFWRGELDALVKEIQTGLDSSQCSLRESLVRESLVLTRSESEPVHNLESGLIGQSVRCSPALQQRPRTTEKRTKKTENSSISSLPKTGTDTTSSGIAAPPTSGSQTSTDDVIVRGCEVTGIQQQKLDDDVKKIVDLLYHPSDFTVSSIQDNPKILKPASLKYDSKTVPVPPFTAEKLSALSDVDLQKHVQQICDVIATPEKGPPSQKRLHLINYAASIITRQEVANLFVKFGALTLLAKQIKEQTLPELRCRLGRLLGLISNNTTQLDESINVTEVLTLLCEVLRDGYRVAKTKHALLPPLGELLYLVACQEEIKGYCVENWSAPSLTYTLILRASRDTEDGVVNHYAAQIVENISTTNSQHAQKFVSNDVGQALWFIFTHAKNDASRVSSIMGLCLLSKQSSAVFQHVIDKSGLVTVLSCMNTSISRIQQSLATMFTQLIISGTLVQRMVQDKDFIVQTMRLLDSSSAIVRAKTFLLVHQILLANQDSLLACCQARLVMYMERDIRRQTPKPADASNDWDYLTKCLQFLQDHVVETLPKITADILSALESVNGRKHPSSAQCRQIKQTLPMMPLYLHILTSQIFRPRVVDGLLIEQLGIFLRHVREVDSGNLNPDHAIGIGSSESFTQTVFSMVESISQHPSILVQHELAVVQHIIPVLATLLTCTSGDCRVLSLKLLTEISSVLLAGEHYTTVNKTSTQLHDVIAQLLLEQYEQVLFDQDPLPAYGLKLLLALIEQSPQFIRKFQSAKLTPALFQVLLDHQQSPLGTVTQTIVAVLAQLVNYKETNMHELYDANLVDHVTSLFFVVAQLCLCGDERVDMKASVTSMIIIIDLLHDIFKYLSEVVRKALQAKKAGADGGTIEADAAEKLLLINKPFTDLTTQLAQLLCHDDADLSDNALKCLSLMVQLFGGEAQEAMSQINMECYNQALRHADARKQKILLRIIKRYLCTDKAHVSAMKSDGQALIKTIQSSIHSASTVADVGVSSLANEILKMAVS